MKQLDSFEEQINIFCNRRIPIPDTSPLSVFFDQRSQEIKRDRQLNVMAQQMPELIRKDNKELLVFSGFLKPGAELEAAP